MGRGVGHQSFASHFEGDIKFVDAFWGDHAKIESGAV